jgi:hypothetical protein
LEQVHIPDDGEAALAQGIIQGSAQQAVSDGSYKPGVIGTAVCIVAADAQQDKDCLQTLIWFQVRRMTNLLTAVS